MPSKKENSKRGWPIPWNCGMRANASTRSWMELAATERVCSGVPENALMSRYHVDCSLSLSFFLSQQNFSCVSGPLPECSQRDGQDETWSHGKYGQPIV